MVKNNEKTDEKVTFHMKTLDEENISINVVFEKSAIYKSIKELTLFETSRYFTRFPGCELRWQARLFRDIFQDDPPQYSISLKLLSCQMDVAASTELTQVTCKCWLSLENWKKEALNITFDLREMKDLPIINNVKLERDAIEKLIQLANKELGFNLEVHVLAEIRPKNGEFKYERGDFTMSPSTSIIRENDAQISSEESFEMISEIFLKCKNFDMFADYSSSKDVTLLQSKEFLTLIPGWTLIWKVRYFRDTYMKPYQNSVSLQLMSCESNSGESAHVCVKCQLRINNSTLPVELDANINLTCGQSVNKTAWLDSNTIEKLLAEARSKVRIGLLLNMNLYVHCDSPTYQTWMHEHVLHEYMLKMKEV